MCQCRACNNETKEYLYNDYEFKEIYIHLGMGKVTDFFIKIDGKYTRCGSKRGHGKIPKKLLELGIINKALYGEEKVVKTKQWLNKYFLAQEKY